MLLKTLTKKSRVQQSRAPNAALYLELAAQMEAQLHAHVLAMWFPRAMDLQHGGFHQNFSQNWTRKNSAERSIVHQARQTWLASQAALHDAAQAKEWLTFARHGFEFLERQLWDEKEGGFFWELDEDSVPAHDGEKHAYGQAFALFALSNYYHAAGDQSALRLALKTFEWLEHTAHDEINGGYYEAFARSGQRILAARVNRANDFIGTPFGSKSANTHLHLLEAFSSLMRVWPAPKVAERLQELLFLIREKLIIAPGTLPTFFDPDWQNATGLHSFGHDIEAAFLLLDAAAALGENHDDATSKIAHLLTNQILDFGWDARYGGVFDSGGANGKVRSDRKIWWVQAEACHTFLLMHEKFGEQTLRYWNAFLNQWIFIDAHQIDHLNGGWYREVSRRGKAPRGQLKSDRWTDGYHQGRALMNMARSLHRLAVRGL